MADMHTKSGWTDEDAYWRTNYRSRPYASSSQRSYDYYQPGYRFGYDAADRYADKSWEDVESSLSRDWNNFEDRGSSTWEDIKGAVKDAWNRMTGKRSPTYR